MASASGPASCTTRRARSTSSILADERAVRHALRPILSGTLDDVVGLRRGVHARSSFPVPAGLRQDQMPSTRREPGADADGREADAEHARRASGVDADADDASEPERRRR